MLLLWGSYVSGVLPVGSSHRSMVNVTLPLALGTTAVFCPTSCACNVNPSQEVCAVGSRLHSSNRRGVPPSSTVLAGIVTVSTPASPSYWPLVAAKAAAV
jgi:hypothetical protein